MCFPGEKERKPKEMEDKQGWCWKKREVDLKGKNKSGRWRKMDGGRKGEKMTQINREK